MYTGTITCLFDSGQIFQESWSINVTTPADALNNLGQIAQDRLLLLPANVRILRLKVTGQPVRKVNCKGKGGTWAHPRDMVMLRDAGWVTRKQLRAVPKGIFAHEQLTPTGRQAFQTFSRTLNRCGCVIVRKGQEPETIRNLTPTRSGLVSSKKAKKATKRKLLALLGAEEGQKFWDGLKKR